MEEHDLQENWQAHDLRTGVAKVYDEAKKRSTLGIRVAASWAVVVLVYGVLGLAEVTRVAPTYWDILAGCGGILLAALSVSRAPAPLLAAAGLVLADVSFVSYGLPELIDRGAAGDHIAAGVRIALAPAAMLFVLNGYFGSLSIQAFKDGFSPGADWRTRMSPRVLQAVVVSSCLVALLLGVGTWIGAIMSGFAQTDVVWFTRSLMYEPIDLTVAKTLDVEEAKNDGKKPGAFANLNVLEPTPEPPFKYPESAVPIESLKGLDDFTRHAVAEAFELAEDLTDSGCIQEGQGRQDRCRDDRCRYWSRVFSRSCLAKGRRTEHFCDNVPEVTAVDEGLKWAEGMCAGRNFEFCREMLYAMQGHCHPPSQDIVRTFLPSAGSSKQ